MATAPRLPDVSDALARVESLLAGSAGPRVSDRLDPAWASRVRETAEQISRAIGFVPRVHA